MPSEWSSFQSNAAVVSSAPNALSRSVAAAAGTADDDEEDVDEGGGGWWTGGDEGVDDEEDGEGRGKGDEGDEERAGRRGMEADDEGDGNDDANMVDATAGRLDARGEADDGIDEAKWPVDEPPLSDAGLRDDEKLPRADGEEDEEEDDDDEEEEDEEDGGGRA